MLHWAKFGLVGLGSGFQVIGAELSDLLRRCLHLCVLRKVALGTRGPRMKENLVHGSHMESGVTMKQ